MRIKQRKINGMSVLRKLVLLAAVLCCRFGFGEGIQFGYQLDRHVDDFSGFRKFSKNFGENDLLYYAKQMVDNQSLYVCDSMPPCALEDGVINWNKQDVPIVSTFQLYLHGLSPIQVLAYAYQCTGKRQYLDFAWDIVQSWLNFNSNSELVKRNKRCWMDHTVALRAESLLYFTQVALGTHLDKANFRVWMNDLLSAHCVHLADDSHYTPNHNHGIIQDGALLHVAYFVHDSRAKNWIELAKRRLSGQKAYAFNKELVHVENSPGYNIAIVKIFDEISDFLSSMDDPVAETFRNEVTGMAEFLAWAYEPNGLMASIGDTFSAHKLSRKCNDYAEWGNRRLAFATSIGEGVLSADEKGIKSKYYPETGYYFYRSNWESNEAINATWKMFKSGYSSRTHKHADDLSFMLYGKGCEIFTDPGMYNYMYGDRFREYFTSASAHNTITVDEQSYSVTEEKCSNVGMLSCVTNGLFEVITAFNDMYPGVSIDRQFISSGDLTILYDDIISSGKLHRYRQLFHLSERMTIISASDEMVLMAITNSEYRVRIRQMTPTVMSIHHGDNLPPLYGHISRTMGEVNESDTLIFERNGVSLEYVTVITIEDAMGNVALQDGDLIKSGDINYDPSNRFIRCGDRHLKITPRQRFNPQLKSVQVSADNKIALEGERVEGGMAGFEIADLKTGEPVAKFALQDSFTLKADLSKFKSDLIVAMEVKKGGQRKKRWVCVLKYEEPQKRHRVALGKDYPALNMEFNQCKLMRMSPATLRCELDYDYSLGTKQKWYVYRNGSGYTSKVTENQKCFEFDCPEPGRYAVLSFLYTPSGDCEFHISPEVCIADEDIRTEKIQKCEEKSHVEFVDKMEITKDNALKISIREYSYAVYLIDAKTAKAIYKSGWQKGKMIKCPLVNSRSDLIVRAYVRSDKTDDRKSVEIGRLRWNDKGSSFSLESNVR